ncbi:response regulator transcription factor [Rubrobacter naiadicus]|uniref:response regulator transcription factor n=1 Tax=Rubrobacter naiadicus TaxID=1392641 RepID=UPI0023617363|nr:response regulator transcription factor [Rubrobacter naiadicus]
MEKTSDRPARLVVVDDHDLVRAGLKAMLSAEPDFEVVGEASDGQAALEVCRRENPDLMLMDVRMPRMDGLAATRAIKQRYPKTSVLILTVHENQEYMLEAIRAGASGYVLKDSPREQLTTAIRKVLDGEVSLNRKLTTALLQQLARNPERTRPVDLNPERERIMQLLTPREMEVLGLLMKGYTNPKIAETLYISLGTVKNHVEHIFAKLEVSDRTQAVVKAFELGIISPADI